MLESAKIKEYVVAPLVGAWIEIKPLHSLTKKTGVAPLVGAWIEIELSELQFRCGIGRLVLCQDLVQVKMSFSHSNLPAIPKLPVDTIFQNHRVTYNRNDYEFVWYYKTFPSIQIPGGMHVCNC